MKKILFIDRDGTLIKEPEDFQIDHLDKFIFLPGVISALTTLKKAGFSLVMVSNQDGLGTTSFPKEDFELCQNLMLSILQSQGIEFEEILICPHFAEQNCECRKPKVGLLLPYLRQRSFDPEHSFVIGDRDTDIELATNLGIKGLKIGSAEFSNWQQITHFLLYRDRVANISRKTKETAITVQLNLDVAEPIAIRTGLGFFDHMLEQLAKHGGFSLKVNAEGDLHIDDHHLVEDCGIAIGQALKQALGDKWGIGRYGFALPMDEAKAQILLDLSGRAFCQFDAVFARETVGEMATEMVGHFFRSFSDSLGANLHAEVKGNNDHHKIEGLFKALGRTLRQAITRVDQQLPTTKGCL